ncbi:hypothetical protein SDJN02_00308, partial [Cucurbita argyrosperma subsp. argyrosperma]
MTPISLCGAAIILGINSNPVLAKDAPSKPSSENGIEESDTIGLRKVEDGSGKLEEAERFFVSAIQEAKEGFGERDPHVASAFNNLRPAQYLEAVESIDCGSRVVRGTGGGMPAYGSETSLSSRARAFLELYAIALFISYVVTTLGTKTWVVYIINYTLDMN